MDGRDTATRSSLDNSSPDNSSSDNSAKAKAWTAVRRALGRMGSRVGVRSVAEDERTILSPVLQSDLALPPPLVTDGSGKMSVSVRAVLAPQAAVGQRESDLLPSVTLARGDYALAAPRLDIMPIASVEIGIKSLALDWPVETVALPASFLCLPSSPVQSRRIELLTPPKNAALRGWLVQTPPVRLLRLPHFADPRVRWGGDSVLRRMPLLRHGRASGAGDAERRRLAETVHLSAGEITLLGVYPDVPILAVERIVVEDEGRRLRLWLKPEALRGRSASHRITLLVGRQNATGKMLQAAL